MITSGEGKYTVWLEEKKIGEDRIYILGGGERSHIGAIILCEPGNKIQVIKRGTHYDHIVLQPIAVAACEKYQVPIVVVGGIHIDNASKQEIDILVQNCYNLIAQL